MSSYLSVCRAIAAASCVVLAVAGCGLQPSERVVEPVGPALAQALAADYALGAAPAPALAPEAAAQPPSGAITLYVDGLHFVPRVAPVGEPGRYTVRLVNDGELGHDLLFPGGTRVRVGPAQTAETQLQIDASGLSFICAVPGHREAGMVGQISVEPPLALRP